VWAWTFVIFPFKVSGMRKALPRQKSTPALAFVLPKSKMISLSYLENAGAYYLERFPATTAQFRSVMKRKITRSIHDHPSQDVVKCQQMLEKVIAKFTELGYLNDLAYGESLVTSLRERGHSYIKILAKLHNKGFDEELIAQILPAQEKDDDLVSALIWIRKKRMGAFSPWEDETHRNKELAALSRAGFSFEHARAALALPVEEAEELLVQHNPRMKLL